MNIQYQNQIILIYLFCKKIDKTSIYGINAFGLASISIILTIFYFTHFMMIAYTEIPIAFFSMLFAYLMIDFKDVKKSILVGVVIGLAIYVKSSAIILPMVLFLFYIANYALRRDKKSFDIESLHNPYQDSRILNGADDVHIESILVGIDIDVGTGIFSAEHDAISNTVAVQIAHPAGEVFTIKQRYKTVGLFLIG